MPDVRLPNGDIIRNVPEGTTKAQLEAKLRAAGYGDDAFRPKEQSSFLGGALDRSGASMMDSLKGVVENAPDILASASKFSSPIGMVRGAITEAMGLQDPEEALAAQVNPAWKEFAAPAKQYFEGQASDLRNAAGEGYFPSLAEAEGVGETLGSIAETGLESIAPMGLAAATGAATKNPALAAGVLNATSTPYGNIREAGGDADSAFLGSALIGALDTIFGAGNIARKVGSAEAVAAAKQATASAITRLPPQALKTAASEGLTEAAQTAIEIVAGGQDPFSPEAQEAILESMVVGGAVGASVSGVADVSNRALAPREETEAGSAPPAPTPPEAPTGPRYTRASVEEVLGNAYTTPTDPKVAARVQEYVETYGREVSSDLELGDFDRLASYLDAQQTRLDSDALGAEEEAARGAILRQARTLLREAGYRPVIEDEVLNEEIGVPPTEETSAQEPAAQEEAPEAPVLNELPELTDEDYEAHPTVIEHNAKFDAYGDEINDLETTRSVRTLTNKWIKQGLLDPGVIDDVNEAIAEEERGYKLDAGIGALLDAIEDARMQGYDDLVSQIDEEYYATQSPAEPVADPIVEPDAVDPVASEPAPTLENPPEVEEEYTPEGINEEYTPEGITEEAPAPPTPNDPAPMQEERAGANRELFKPLNKLQERFNYKYAEAPNVDRHFGGDYLAPEFETHEAKKAGAVATVNSRFIKPILNKMVKMNVDPQDLGMYMLAKAAADRNANVAKRNAAFPTGGSGLTDAEAQDVLNEFRRQGKLAQLEEFDNMRANMVKHVLNEMVRMGNMSARDRDALLANEPNWVKLSGFAKGDNLNVADETLEDAAWGGLRSAPGVSHRNFITPQGRVSLPFNPLFNTMEWAQRAVSQAQINPVGQQLLRMMNTLSPAERARIGAIYTDKKPKIVTHTSEDEVTGVPKAVPNMKAEMNKKRENWLEVKQGGVSSYIEFNRSTPEGEAIARLFQNSTPQEVSQALKLAGRLAATMRSFMTRRNPNYMVVAPSRDVAEAEATIVALTNNKNSPAYKKPLLREFNKEMLRSTHNAQALRAWLNGSKPVNAEQARTMKRIDEMMQDGGASLHSMFETAERMAEKAVADAKTALKANKGNPLAVSKNTLKAGLHALDMVNDLTDLTPRFAAYLAARKVGISRADAGRIALDSTLDLSRKGTLAKYTDTLWPFFSVSTEGTRKLGRIAGGKDIRWDNHDMRAWEAIKKGQFQKVIKNPAVTLKVVGAMLALGAAEAGLGMLFDGDEDKDERPDYLDVPEGMQLTRMVIKYGPGGDDYILLPMGQMLGFFKYIGSQMASVLAGKAAPEGASLSIAAAAQNIGDAFLQNISPARVFGGDIQSGITALLPLGIKPMVEAFGTNKNFFGSDISREPSKDEQVKAYLGRAATGEMWKAIAAAMNKLTGGSELQKGGIDAQPEAYRYFITQLASGPGKLISDLAGVADGTTNEKGARAVPVVKGFLGKGFDFVPMNNYKKNTARIAQYIANSKNATESTDARWRKNNPVDAELIEAYKDSQARLKKANEAWKDLREEVTDPVKQDAITDAQREEAREIYEEFNRQYVQTKRRLDGGR